MDLTQTKLNGIKHIHLMGIGGAGMSGLALLLKELGFAVSGCDMTHSFYADKIINEKIDFVLGHHENHLQKFSPDLLIYSSAIPPDNKELKAAERMGISVAKRGEVLSWIFDSSFGIGVAGAHGKTTTSSMISMVLGQAGLKPTVAIGGELCDIGCNAKLGSGPHMVAELDESDGSFEHFHPSISVITNIDWDHVNHYPSIESVLEAFQRFSGNIKDNGISILCGEDRGVSRLLEVCHNQNEIITYGWGTNWDWGAYDVVYHYGGGVSFSVCCGSNFIGKIQLRVSGDHNIMNSLAACVVANQLDVPFSVVQSTLKAFKGAKRRLQFRGEEANIEVYDDYAHHPCEVAATLRALKQMFPEKNTLIIFQPHRYTRTAAMADYFSEVLSMADKLVLLPIYAADEEPLEGVSSKLIYEKLGKRNYLKCKMCNSHLEAATHALDIVEREGIIVTIGAGDVSLVGDLVLDRLRNKEMTFDAVAVGA